MNHTKVRYGNIPGPEIIFLVVLAILSFSHTGQAIAVLNVVPSTILVIFTLIMNVYVYSK